MDSQRRLAQPSGHVALALVLMATICLPSLQALQPFIKKTGMWTPHHSCGASTCDASNMCLAAGSASKHWDACPEGTVQLSIAMAPDMATCAPSKQCTTARSCPTGSAYLSCSCGDCWGCAIIDSTLRGSPAANCSAGGRAYITCCEERPQATCARLLPCTYTLAAGASQASESGPQARLSKAAVAGCRTGNWLGDLAAGKIMENPIFAASMEFFPALGGVMGSMPVVARWFAARWDGAVRPIIGQSTCGNDTAPDALYDNGLATLKLLFLPGLQSWFKTPTGALAADALATDLNFDTKTLADYLTRDNLMVAIAALSYLTGGGEEWEAEAEAEAEAANSISVQSLRRARALLERGRSLALAKPGPWDPAHAALAGRRAGQRRALLQGGEVVFDGDMEQEPISYGDGIGSGINIAYVLTTLVGSVVGDLGYTVLGVLYAVVAELGAADSRVGTVQLAKDVSDLLGGMVGAALAGPPAALGADPFAAALFNMTAGEKAAFVLMRDALTRFKPAIDDMEAAVTKYPAPLPSRAPLPALPKPPAPANVTASVFAPATLAGSPYKYDCTADPANDDYDGLWTFLSQPLLPSPVFRTALDAPAPAAELMRTIPPLLAWYAARWDMALQPLLATGVCTTDSPTQAQLDMALKFLRFLGMPVLRRYLQTNTGVGLKALLKDGLGFNTSTLDAYMTAANVRMVVQGLQGEDGQAVADEVAAVAPYALLGIAGLAPGLLGGGGEGFNIVDVMMDALTAMFAAADTALAGAPENATAASTSAGRRLLATTDADMEKLFAMSAEEKAQFRVFILSVIGLQESLATAFAAAGVSGAPPKPGTLPRETLQAIAAKLNSQMEEEAKKDDGLSKGALAGIIAGSVGGAVLIGGVIIAAIVISKNRRQGRVTHG